MDSAPEGVKYKKSLLAERSREPWDDFLVVLASAEAKGILTEEEAFANAMLLLLPDT